MNISKLLFICFIFNIELSAQIDSSKKISAKIYIKPYEKEMICEIRDVTSYGLITTDEKTISYKVISKISTSSEELVNLIENSFSNISIEKQSDTFVIEFSKPTMKIDNNESVVDVNKIDTVWIPNKLPKYFPANIFIKPYGKEITCEIREVTHYGVITNSEMISYRVISKIATSSKELADSLIHHIFNVAAVKDSEKYIIDFSKAEFEKINYKNNKLLNDEYSGINILSNRGENIEVVVNAGIKYSEFIYLQLSYTNGRFVKNYSYSLSAISFGAGVKYKSAIGDILFGINYGRKSLFISPVKMFEEPIYSSGIDHVAYLEFAFRNNLFNKWLFYLVDAKYYFDNISVVNVNTRFSFGLGLGIKFSNL